LKTWQRLTGAVTTDDTAGDVFAQCSAGLRRYLRRRLRNAADVPDLTQEIFERFIRANALVRARSPAAYLFGIASNVVAETRAAQQRESVVFDSGTFHRAAETASEDGRDVLHDLALESALARALEQLPDIHRAAILLTKRDGLSSKEAAMRLGITEGSVRVYVCEARARLRDLLKEE